MAKHPDFPGINYNIGNVHLRQRRFGKAIVHYGKESAVRADRMDEQLVVNDNPDLESNLYFNFGFALFMEGRYEEAVRQFRLVLQENPRDATAHNFLGKSLASMGKLKEAAIHFGKAVDLNPADAEARANLRRVRTLRCVG